METDAVLNVPQAQSDCGVAMASPLSTGLKKFHITVIKIQAKLLH
jgi:hypothetical protein